MKGQNDRFIADFAEISSLNLDELDVIDAAQDLRSRIVSMLDSADDDALICTRRCNRLSGKM